MPYHKNRNIIDGDGWANITELQDYKRKQTMSAEVILEKAVAPYPDLPVTVAPIVAELQPEHKDGAKAADIARRFACLEVSGRRAFAELVGGRAELLSAAPWLGGTPTGEALENVDVEGRGGRTLAPVSPCFPTSRSNRASRRSVRQSTPQRARK